MLSFLRQIFIDCKGIESLPVFFLLKLKCLKLILVKYGLHYAITVGRNTYLFTAKILSKYIEKKMLVFVIKDPK